MIWGRLWPSASTIRAAQLVVAVATSVLSVLLPSLLPRAGSPPIESIAGDRCGDLAGAFAPPQPTTISFVRFTVTTVEVDQEAGKVRGLTPWCV